MCRVMAPRRLQLAQIVCAVLSPLDGYNSHKFPPTVAITAIAVDTNCWQKGLPNLTFRTAEMENVVRKD